MNVFDALTGFNMSEQSNLAVWLEQPLREVQDLAHGLHLACRGLHPDIAQPSDEEINALINLSDALSRRVTQLRRKVYCGDEG